MSRQEKLIQRLLGLPTTMRFSEVKLIIESHGYVHHHPRGGSHHVFRRAASELMSIPVHNGEVKRIYLRDVIRKLGLAKETEDE